MRDKFIKIRHFLPENRFSDEEIKSISKKHINIKIEDNNVIEEIKELLEK